MKTRYIRVAAIFKSAVVGVTVVLSLAGCAATHTIPLGSSSANLHGGFRLYGTSNTPFLYEEIAFISHAYNKDAYKNDQCVNLFIQEAKKMGADAVVNFEFKHSPGTGGFFLVITGLPGFYVLSGVAVRIERP